MMFRYHSIMIKVYGWFYRRLPFLPFLFHWSMDHFLARMNCCKHSFSTSPDYCHQGFWTKTCDHCRKVEMTPIERPRVVKKGD